MIKRKMVRGGDGERCARCQRIIPNGAYAMCESGRTWTHEGACPIVAASADYATERQVQFAADLIAAYWTPAVFGGRQYSRDELSVLTKQQISGVIDALIAERDVQTH